MEFIQLFKFSFTKFIILLVLFISLPFFVYKDVELGACTKGISDECREIPPEFEFIASPRNSLMIIGWSLGAYGTKYQDQVILYNRLLLIIKLIFSYIISSLILIYLQRKKR